MTATLQLLPPDRIVPSHTQVQTLRRAHLNEDRLTELAESIAINGVLQPILVRVAPTADDLHRYEIVAGERRWIAAQRAGLAQIPAIVRDMTDTEVLEAQIVENLQREGLQALEEAEGYAELMHATGCNAEAVGEKIGKSRSYVYARLKLLDLIPQARDALQRGQLDASKALVLARIHGEKMQARALELVLDGEHDYSYRDLMAQVSREAMIDLDDAPWLPDHDQLTDTKGQPCRSCTGCPSRSLSDPALAAELEGRDVCLDGECFDLKRSLHWIRTRAELQAAGKTLITGKDAKPYPVHGSYPTVSNGFLRLDDTVDTITFPEPEPVRSKNEPDDAFEAREDAWQERLEAWEPPTYLSLIGEPEGTVYVETDDAIIPCAPVEAVAKILKAKKIKLHWSIENALARTRPQQQSAALAGMIEAERREQEKAEAQERIEREYRDRLIRTIAGKYKGPLKQPELQHLAEILSDWDSYDQLEGLFDQPIVRMSEPELLRYVVLWLLCRENECTGDKPDLTLQIAQRLNIDPKKIRAEVTQALKPTAAPGQGKGGKGGRK